MESKSGKRKLYVIILFITSSNLQPSIISSLIILEGFSEMINSIKIFHECVCVSEYAVSLCFSSSPLSLSPPHTNQHIHREFSFLQDCGNENSYFIPQINFLGEGENRNSFGINLTCGLLERDAFSGVNQLFDTLKEWSLSQKMF